MKRKNFCSLFLTVIVTLSFYGCKPEDSGSAPVIEEAFFVSPEMKKAYEDNCKTLTPLEYIDLYNTPQTTSTYYLYIAFSDEDMDVVGFDEITIPDTMNGKGTMPSVDCFVMIPVYYLTTEVPSSKIAADNTYTFKYQARDAKGNKSNVYPVTISVGESNEDSAN